MLIQINLLPGVAKPVETPSGTDWRALADRLRSGIRYPWFIGTATASVLSLALVALLYSKQQQRSDEVARRREHAVRDSTRYARVLGTRRRLHDERDGISRQLQIIRSIDDNRYNWAHILEEVSRALPAYTWLTSMEQTSAVPTIPVAQHPPTTAPGTSPAAGRGARTASAPAAPADSVPVAMDLTFRITGQTVDIQALTLFMRQLEQSPFLQRVALAKSEAVMVDGTEVTQFELTATYETPSAARLQTTRLVVPLR